MVEPFERLLSVDEAAELLGGLNPKTLMRLARKGQIPAFKLGKLWRFRASVLNQWLVGKPAAN
jgi:excisionase family DNA binding protein